MAGSLTDLSARANPSWSIKAGETRDPRLRTKGGPQTFIIRDLRFSDSRTSQFMFEHVAPYIQPLPSLCLTCSDCLSIYHGSPLASAAGLASIDSHASASSTNPCPPPMRLRGLEVLSCTHLESRVGQAGQGLYLIYDRHMFIKAQRQYRLDCRNWELTASKKNSVRPRPSNSKVCRACAAICQR